MAASAYEDEAGEARVESVKKESFGQSCTDQTRSDRAFLICTLRYKVNFIEKLLWKMFVPLFVE